MHDRLPHGPLGVGQVYRRRHALRDAVRRVKTWRYSCAGAALCLVSCPPRSLRVGGAHRHDKDLTAEIRDLHLAWVVQGLSLRALAVIGACRGMHTWCLSWCTPSDVVPAS